MTGKKKKCSIEKAKNTQKVSIERFMYGGRLDPEIFDFVFMVDEPLHVASRRRVSWAGAMLAVA